MHRASFGCWPVGFKLQVKARVKSGAWRPLLSAIAMLLDVGCWLLDVPRAGQRKHRTSNNQHPSSNIQWAQRETCVMTCEGAWRLHPCDHISRIFLPDPWRVRSSIRVYLYTKHYYERYEWICVIGPLARQHGCPGKRMRRTPCCLCSGSGPSDGLRCAASSGAPPPQASAAPVPEAPPAQPEVTQAPPPLQAEVIPPPPGDAYVWAPGYWYWGAGGWVWMGGRYVIPPHPHAVWVGPHWGRHGRGYVWVGGYWR
jgi:hypothetical protein